MSLWILVLLVVLSAAAAVGLVVVVRRRAPAIGHFVQPAGAVGRLTVMGSLLAVLTAFVIFVALDNHHTAKDRAVQEAVATSHLYGTTALFPDPLGSDLRGDLMCYARSVVSDEWGADDAEPSSRVQDWLDAMNSSLARFDPTTEREKVAYSEFFMQDSDRREGRRGRLNAGSSVIPNFLWVVLLLSAVVVIGCELLMIDPRDRVLPHAMLTAGLTVMLVAALSTIQYLGNPFAGGGAIKPREMQRTIVLIESSKSPALDLSTLPCNAAGARL